MGYEIGRINYLCISKERHQFCTIEKLKNAVERQRFQLFYYDGNAIFFSEYSFYRSCYPNIPTHLPYNE